MNQGYSGLPTHNISKALDSLGFSVARASKRHRLFRHEDGRVTTLPVPEHAYLSRVLVRMIARDVGPELDDYLKWLE